MLSVFFCFVFGLLASLIPEAQGHCRNLRFTSAHIHGYWLKNHVIRTIRVSNEDICEWQCYLEPNCVSYNFKKKEETNGGHQCDLNNATYEHDNEHSGDLGKHRHFVYRGAENACAKKRCKNKATCQAGFTDKDYQCLCTLGFTGDHCENDVNECTRKTHSCDVNAKCVNTPGSYECTCKDGFHGDGKQCTDIDECANGTHSCDDNAVCNNTLGSYNCTCKDGFYGDGTNCTEKPRSVIICEHVKRNISCQNGKIIDVLDANYGRLDDHLCSEPRTDINCRATNSLDIVKKKCNQKVSCELLATNQEFGGDPCPNTFKYLEVKYSCLEYIVGWYSGHPGHSCKHIRDSGGSRGDGEYWIDPEKSGTPLKVFCDMTTDAGGWLLVSNLVIDNPSSPQLSVETSYRDISNYHNNKMFLTKSAMNELRTHLPFTQLRFHCSKQQGRTFHVTTAANSAGEAVVQYFSGQTDVQPDACDSFVRMENDNSLLVGKCNQWGHGDYTGKWGGQKDKERLYDHAAWVFGKHHWLMNGPWKGGSRWECDDFLVGVSSGDFWKVFVR